MNSDGNNSEPILKDTVIIGKRHIGAEADHTDSMKLITILAKIMVTIQIANNIINCGTIEKDVKSG